MAVASPARAPRSVQLTGALMCAGSAAAFGAMAIFGKLAYDAGVGVLTLLMVRFALAAPPLWGLWALRGRRRAGSRLPRGRRLAIAFALGAIGYTAQAALFFVALTRIDAALTALVLYLYPSFVTIAAAALGRDSLDRVRAAALVLAFGGLVLVLFTGASGEVDALGVALALCSALSYTAYILISETAVAGTDPLSLSALVCTGAATSLVLAGLVSGRADLGFDAIGWLWLAAIAAVSTVLAILLFFAGLSRVGPSRASIISTVEPLVTVLLAFVVFGEALTAAQLLGGALVLASVVLLQTMGRGPEPPAA
jgi:drug/metabolite transporter (DMT)-like permease